MGRAVQQDFEHQTFHFFFTSPIAKRDYFVGRFLGALGAARCCIFLGIALGMRGRRRTGLASSLAHRALVGSRRFVRPYLLMLLPNMLFIGAVFFALGGAHAGACCRSTSPASSC